MFFLVFLLSILSVQRSFNWFNDQVILNIKRFRLLGFGVLNPPVEFGGFCLIKLGSYYNRNKNKKTGWKRFCCDIANLTFLRALLQELFISRATIFAGWNPGLGVPDWKSRFGSPGPRILHFVTVCDSWERQIYNAIFAHWSSPHFRIKKPGRDYHRVWFVKICLVMKFKTHRRVKHLSPFQSPIYLR